MIVPTAIVLNRPAGHKI